MKHSTELHPFFVEKLAQSLTINEFRRDEVARIDLTDFVDGENVRMV